MLAVVLIALVTCADALRLPVSARAKSRSSALADFPSHPGYTGPETTPLLDQVSSPAVLKRFDIKQVGKDIDSILFVTASVAEAALP